MDVKRVYEVLVFVLVENNCIIARVLTGDMVMSGDNGIVILQLCWFWIASSGAGQRRISPW